MEKRKRKDYVAPVTESVELKAERILCMSGGEYDPFLDGGELFI